MGFRYRKSFKAGPIRVTASKSGISYSAGVKGARVTKRADGRVQTTLSAPGTGLSYTKSSGSTKKPNRDSSRQTSKPAAMPRNRAVKPSIPTRSELKKAWRATGQPLPVHGPRINERKATLLAGLMTLLARPDEETRFFLSILKVNPTRDVLVLTSQRLLMFQTSQVLHNGQILGVDLSSVREVTIRRRFSSTSLVLHDVDGTDQIVCGNISTKGLAWLREATQDDPMFVLSG